MGQLLTYPYMDIVDHLLFAICLLKGPLPHGKVVVEVDVAQVLELLVRQHEGTNREALDISFTLAAGRHGLSRQANVDLVHAS